jgi:hypothetical protein
MVSLEGGVSLRLLSILLILGSLVSAQTPKPKAQFQSTQAKEDVALNVDPNSAFWRGARPVFMQVDIQGHPETEYRTEVRSRWTKKNIYFLFICPYKNLYLKPGPDTERETYELWNWNVAEVFIGTNFKNIKRYKEFEISPQGEWIDLDIDLDKPHHEEGWVWNSGFEHTARIDQASHTWYAAIRIPFSALDTATPAPGTTFRVNLFRTEGSANNAKEILWQPTMSQTFHVPERFGLLKLSAK